MATPSYSLSSAASTTRRMSSQLSRVMGSGSRESSRRRVVSEDGMINHAAAHSNNHMSKAAAWMWHTRGIGELAVLPTKVQRPLVNGISKLPPSRFKRQASTMASDPAHQSCSTASAAHPNYAGHDQTARASAISYSAAARESRLKDKEENREAEPSSKGNAFLYDEFELSRLQELIDTQTDGSTKSLSGAQLCSSTSSSSIGCSSSRQTKRPLSALHKLLKKLYTSVVHSSAPKSALPYQTVPSSRNIQTVQQHVIHHHHHHYHHHHSLDLGSHIEFPPNSPTHMRAVVGRRRHSEVFTRAPHLNNRGELHHLVNDSLYADAH